MSEVAARVLGQRVGAVRAVAVAGAALAAATAASAVLEQLVGVADASPVYLLAVVLVASRSGTWPAVAVSGLSFLIYDYLFTVPQFTFAVSDPAEWLSLLLFLSIAVVIGRLAALLRDRAEVADRRSRESVSLASIGREIAMAQSYEEAAPRVAERLRDDAEMAAVTVHRDDGTGGGSGSGPVPWTLLRSATDGSSDWVRIVEGGAATDDTGRRPGDAAAGAGTIADDAVFLVQIEADGRRLGRILATRLAGSPMPGRGARRILALAADQLGIAIRRDELREEVTAAEIARRGDALRAAILDSVSHDLRTPLASIRATAGGLLDQAVAPAPGDVRTAAAAIDDEAARLGELVGSLLDMGRIQSGAVRPDLEPYEVDELVDTAVRRVARGSDRDRVRIAIPHGLPPVLADAVLADVAIGNVIDNAIRHAVPPAAVIVTAEAARDRAEVRISVDDAGAGVPDDELPRLFERFYRVPGDAAAARHGIGMGLAIARGFVAAMGGSVSASRSELGGLRLTIALPVAPEHPAADGGAS